MLVTICLFVWVSLHTSDPPEIWAYSIRVVRSKKLTSSWHEDTPAMNIENQVQNMCLCRVIRVCNGRGICMIVEYSGCVSGLKWICCYGGVACPFFVFLLYPLHCYEILIKILSKLKIFPTKPATSLECYLTESIKKKNLLLLFLLVGENPTKVITGLSGWWATN